MYLDLCYVFRLAGQLGQSSILCAASTAGKELPMVILVFGLLFLTRMGSLIGALVNNFGKLLA